MTHPDRSSSSALDRPVVARPGSDHDAPATGGDEVPTPSGPLGPRGAVDAWSPFEEFASLIGHELRTPLAVVKAAAETGINHHDKLGTQGLLKLLATIMRNSDLALLLVDRIGLARDVEGDDVGLAHERIDLATLVAESVDDLGHVVLNGHPTRVYGLDSLEVRGDATALREIVFNLLANAAKYSAADAEIDVTVRRAGDDAEVVIRDHGTGVAPGDTETIFGMFYQGNPTSPGAGLGLYISRGLARAHDGDLHVQPAKGRGSEFVLTVPAWHPVRSTPTANPLRDPGAAQSVTGPSVLSRATQATNGDVASRSNAE